jgi:quinol monooxygenase YgiN
MTETYTHSVWRVKPGREDEFVRLWLDLVQWSSEQGLTAKAKLLRDPDNPGLFISFGPWESLGKVAVWRSSRGFHERIAALQQLLEAFEPRTLVLVAEG